MILSLLFLPDLLLGFLLLLIFLLLLPLLSLSSFHFCFSSAASFFFLSSSRNILTYSFAVIALAPVIRFVRFFATAASSDGAERISAKSGCTNPADARGFTIGEDIPEELGVTGREQEAKRSMGVLVSTPLLRLLCEHQGDTVGKGVEADVTEEIPEVLATSVLVLATDDCEGGQDDWDEGYGVEESEEDSFKDEECKVEGIILAFSTASGLKG